MPKEEFNKISFNNFKPFGEKMQTFTQKPITLIYGPNSIGKSSLLQGMLYHEYIKIQSKYMPDTSDLNLPYTNLFGDELNLGGFDHYIHEHDWKLHLQYITTLIKEEDIAKTISPFYIELKKFKEEGVFEMIDDLMEKFEYSPDSQIRVYKQLENTYYIHSIDKLLYKKLINIQDKQSIKDNFIQNNIFKSSDDIDVIFQQCLLSKDTLQDICYREDGKKLDVLDRFILFLMDQEQILDKYFSFKDDNSLSFDFYQYSLVFFKRKISLYRYIANISSIKLSREVFYSEKKKCFINKNKLYTNNDLFFTVSKIKNKPHFKIKKNHPILIHMFDRQKKVQNEFINTRIKSKKYIPFLDILDIYIHHNFLTGIDNKSKIQKDYIEDMIFYISEKVFYSGSSSDSQYIGPIRWLPDRADLRQNLDYRIDTNVYVDPDDILEKIEFDIFSKIKKLPESIQKHKFLVKTYLFFFMAFSLIRSIPFFISNAFKSPYVIDYFNTKKKKKNKLSSGKAKTTEKMWEEVIASEDIREKLNKWLGDDTKLKSTYNLIIEEHIEKNSLIKKIFKVKEDGVKVLSFVDLRSNTQVSIKDMGLGISQVLPVLISCFTQKNTQIFLEQPELHLHPAIQAELADEFIRSYKENNNGFMIETHSEHLLLRIMKRMRYTAEGRIDKNDVLALSPDDVCLLYVDNDGNNTFINELELDEDGTLLDPWPDGFFEEGHKERFD